MHIASSEDTRPIERVEELHEYFTSACKPTSEWRVGTEFELLGVQLDPERLGDAPAYEGAAGIRALLEWLAREKNWTPIVENDYIIALAQGNTQITFEPGGQFEMAARPVYRADELKQDLERFLGEVALPTEQYNLAWLGLGFRPFGTRESVPWMPKRRYEIMRAYMPQVGGLGLDMMKRTGTVQVNLDFSDANDARDKMRTIMSITSLLTALFANSPIVDEQDSGYQSFRAQVWRDTDPDRCGLLDFVFEDRDIFEAYVEWALGVPMYFLYRNGVYHEATHMTFGRFLREGFNGERATMDDWATHLSTLFPEARMKKYMEVRGCDCGCKDMVLALAPLCQGLLYDADARREAIALTASLDFNERRVLQRDVARDGLRAQVKGRPVGELVTEMLDIATHGLERQAPGELAYLQPLRDIAGSGRTQADRMLDVWRRTGGDRRALIEHAAFIGSCTK